MSIPGLPADAEALLQYKSDYWKFLSDCVFTLDQADKWRPIKRYPAQEKPYLKPIVQRIIHERLLAIVKSRRMVITWTVCAVWLADAMFNEGRFNALVSQKEEASDELVQRCKFIYDNIPRDKLKLLPDAKYKYTELEFPEIKSVIKGVASGANQLRQYTCSRVGCDEIAFWPKARETFTGLRPTIEGGGQILFISTRFPGFFRDVIEDKLNVRDAA